jgi:hypothetical protein
VVWVYMVEGRRRPWTMEGHGWVGGARATASVHVVAVGWRPRARGEQDPRGVGGDACALH